MSDCEDGSGRLGCSSPKLCCVLHHYMDCLPNGMVRGDDCSCSCRRTTFVTLHLPSACHPNCSCQMWRSGFFFEVDAGCVKMLIHATSYCQLFFFELNCTCM